MIILLIGLIVLGLAGIGTLILVGFSLTLVRALF